MHSSEAAMMVRCLIMLIPEGLVKYLRTNLTEFNN